MESIFDLLGEKGPLSKTMRGFAVRKQQQEMAQCIADTLKFDDVLIAEAGTGTGKTVAYLVPILLSGKKVIISTGTKNLQDQLYRRDLPMVRDALGTSVATALLKGRANYLCRYRFDRLTSEGRLTQDQLQQYQHIQQWMLVTRSGDIAEIKDVAEDASIWPLVTSTTDNCLGSDCPDYQECYVLKARKQAQQADVLVVNHHLFFADLALRDEGFGEILPGANAFVFDEAHQLSEIATQFFGVSLSSRQLMDLAKDALAEMLQDAGDQADIQDISDKLQKATRDFRLQFGRQDSRGPWAGIADNLDLTDALDHIITCLENLEALLELNAGRGGGIERCWQRATTMKARADHFMSFVPRLADESDTQAGPESDVIKWYETRGKGFILHMTPLNIANTFHEYMKSRDAAWVFTSATLAVGQSFDYFSSNLGIESNQSRQWGSPFDYQQQGLLYIPRPMPEPGSREYTRHVVEKALPVINASGGRTFILLTSYRALDEAARMLKGKITYPLLIQGSQPRTELLNEFRERGNAVLIGTSSFWEGVDVKGQALSCVIIDKLPFAAPDQPILQARINAMREQGINPFMHYQLPEAVITLKQGVGRLIRDVDDHGVLMLCDPRLLSKSYGRTFFNNLPNMPLTHDIADVQQFFGEVYA